ncbi:MAG: U32 family peptidase [Treponema sp.]|nr:U32 family peptidase [Treponema sp.]
MTELLAPAGNVEALDAAIGEGADAVYLGLKSFNARLRSSNFAWREFEAAVQSVHRQGKKIYVTVNTVCEENETERLYRFLSYLNKIGPDGLIVQDFGVVRMCQEFFPGLEIHASTQMNVESSAAANELYRQGIKRVVLARELGLEEIRAVKEATKAELEVFVHGALCVSESGLCLFSSFLGGKSANRGMCTQACRRYYTAETPGGDTQGYYFSPADLQLIDHIPELMKIGVDSFKIEGRMKSAEYVGAVTAAYRYVMDHWESDRKGAIAEGKRILSTDFARSKTDYWYGFGKEGDGIDAAGEKILNPNQAGGTGIYLGKIHELRPANEDEKLTYMQALKKTDGDDDAAVPEIQMAVIKGGDYEPDPGDSIRLHRKDDTGRESHKVRVVTVDEGGKRWVDIPTGFTRLDDIYLLQTKSMSKRYKRVLPQDLSKFRTQPADEQLPILDLTQLKQNELSWFPEGLYIGVSTVADAHVVQSLHPVRVILELNNETEYDLLNKSNGEKPILPYSKRMVIINLDPFVAEGRLPSIEKTILRLVDLGYENFMVNNLAHINILRGKDVNMIAGPYLYTFNRWAISFLENEGVMVYQMPYENSEKNLADTFTSPEEKSRLLLPVFAYPTLFRMRFKLPRDYDFTYFEDKEGMVFKVNSTADGSFVMPEVPFSIVDKMNSIAAKGWKRLLIDFSKTRVKRGDTKDMFALMQGKALIDGASRFNWKDGFYNPEKMEAYKAISEKQRMEQGNRKPASAKKYAQKKSGPKKTATGKNRAGRPKGF